MNNDAMNFAANLKRLRKAAKLTQEQLAHACGYSGQSRIGNYEATGEHARTPSLEEIPLIAAALNVDIAELFGQQSAPYKVSQPVRFDPEIVRDVARALQEVYAEDLGRAYSITEEPELFVEMYERVVERGQVDSRSNMVWLGSRMGKAPQGVPKDERSKNVHGEGHAEGKVGSRGSQG